MDHVAVDAVPALAFGLSDELGPVDSGWHAHVRHQLLYARSGVLRLETADAAWVLPPRRAAWIRGGTAHRVVVQQAISLRTVYVDPALAAGPPDPVRVFPVTALAREMLLHAMRWGPERDPADPVAAAFFGALAALCDEWAAAAAPFSLPRGRSPQTRRAIAWTLAHLDDPGLAVEGAARAAALSPRTLRRRLVDETGQPWRALVQQARMLRAVEVLSDPQASVGEACDAAGFRSLGTFSRQFSAALGESPLAWQRRAVGA